MSTINTQIQSLTSAMNLDRTQDQLSSAINQLSSGSRLVNPGSDPAALADSASLGADGKRLSAASTNIQDTLSYTQSATGYLSTMDDILNRMSELSSETQDPTKSASDSGNYELEFKSLQDELRSLVGGSSSAIGGTSNTTPAATFNGTTLFGSTASGGMTVGIGDNASSQLKIPDIDLQSGAMQALISQDSSGNYTLSASDPTAQSGIASAMQQVGDGRTTLGGIASRLNLTASSIAVEQQNVASAISGMSDVDIAQQSTQLAKYNILSQSGAAMLAQANLSPEAVLKLLKS